MSHKVSDELISAYLDGELTADEQALVERVLTADPERRRTYEQWRALRHSLQSLPDHHLDTDLSPFILEAAQRAVSSRVDRPAATGKGTAPRAASVGELPGPSVCQQTTSPTGRRQRQIVWTSGIVAAAATAALVTLMLSRPAAVRDEALSGRIEAPADVEAVARPAAPADSTPEREAGPSAPRDEENASPGREIIAERGPVKVPVPSPDRFPAAESQSRSPSPLAPSRESAGRVEPTAEPSIASAGAKAEKLASPPAKVDNAKPAPAGGMEIVAQILPRIEMIPESAPRSAFGRIAPLPGAVIMLLDLNQDGLITDAETRQSALVLQNRANAGDRQGGGQAILDAFDQNGDGRLDRDEALRGAAAARMHVDGSGKSIASLMGALDADADGTVTVWEFRTLLDKLGRMGPLVEPRLSQLFAGVDANQDGMISVVESQMAAETFLRQSRMEVQTLGPGGQPLVQQPVVPVVRATIVRLDRNRDGLLSAGEAKKDPQLRQVFAEVDRNGDGQLVGGELYDYLTQRLSPQSPPSGIRVKLSVARPKPTRRP